MNDYTAPVGDYLRTADGAVKMIPHRSETAEAKNIRQAFRDLTGAAA